MRSRSRTWWSSLVVLAVVAAACSGRGGDGPEAATAARFVSAQGVLLDADLAPVGELELPKRAFDVSVADDGRIVFASDVDATESQDCCGPNMESLFVTALDGGEPEPLFPGRIGVADSQPDWSPGGDQVVFARRTAPVYSEDGNEPPGLAEGLWVYTPGDDAPRLLVEGGFVDATWSPDGSLIAASESWTDPAQPGPTVHLFDARTGATVASIGVSGARVAWSPSGDRLVVEADGAGASSRVGGIYDIETDRLRVVPETETLETRVWVWGAQGPIVELNRAKGASLLARVDPESLTVTGLHRCTAEGPCDRPVAVLPG